ncbi:UBX domain-containing protein 4 isoform X2 [Cydia pomonella]|uniref:UBX domain-containing protein 4 isoform X2 n=1 Tax=Cydia pomonella TaxID=82600 RepID=UPI002ADE2375|nr:UBX domain-containing protein 4 isoform X2 [Cydia pomonella]
MHWYGGSIAEAVTLSKQKNAIFVVFVEGDNDLSSEMTSVLDDAAVLQRLGNSTNFLAIRLKSGSTDYTHFAQIYQFVPVPSLFFIGRNGTPLEVVCAGVQPGNLATRIDRILEEHHKEKPAPPPSNIKEQTANLLASESTPAPTPGGSKVPATAPVKEPEPSEPAAKMAKLDDQEVVCNDGVCIRRPRADGAGPSKTPDAPQKEPEAKLAASESTLSAEEKMERAKALIEAKRKEKAEKERQLEKEREKERRNIGQGVAELKKWQAEQELKQLQEERKREKMENDLARQRILEQIAQDRAERRARESRDVPQPQECHRRETATVTSGDGALQARVQFKLPDGTTHTNHFPAEARLAEVHRYVADNLDLPTAQFSLWLAFPRRELTDTEATLRRLELAPSAALLVLPRAAVPARPSTVGNIIAIVSQLLSTMIFEPSTRLYTWLMSLVPARGAPPAPGGAAPSASPAGGAAPAAAARRGNVHRLRGERPDDDNNTWNGNSTQQM